MQFISYHSYRLTRRLGTRAVPSLSTAAFFASNATALISVAVDECSTLSLSLINGLSSEFIVVRGVEFSVTGITFGIYEVVGAVSRNVQLMKRPHRLTLMSLSAPP